MKANPNVCHVKSGRISPIGESTRLVLIVLAAPTVIVKEAQNMKDLVPKDHEKKENGVEKSKEEKIHPFTFYLENPQKSTILVFCHKYKTIDMRSAFAKTLSKKAVVMKSDTMHEYKVPKWIEGFLAEKKYAIEPQASKIGRAHV